MTLHSKKILFAWELGEGLGHLPPLKAIASALKREGAVPVFALRDTVLTRPALANVGAQTVQAPYWSKPSAPEKLSASYADILAGNGYGSASTARELITAWDTIIDLVKPDIVICEHSPTAALSAFGRVPVAFVGNGFVVPPADGETFPPYEPERGDAKQQRVVYDIIQEAFAGLGKRAPASICEGFRGVFRGIYTFPALDTYRHIRCEAVLGPIEASPALAQLPTTRRVFVYSTADLAMIEALVHGVLEIGPEASVYFRGKLGVRGTILKSRGVHVYDAAPELSVVLPQTSVLFSHGGTGFANAALASGRPHIVYPRHFEAQSTARAFEGLGCGIIINSFDGNSFREAVKRASQDRAMQEAAQRAGAAAQNFIAQTHALDTTLDALRKILA